MVGVAQLDVPLLSEGLREGRERRWRKGEPNIMGVEEIIRKEARVVFMDSSPEMYQRHAPPISLCLSLTLWHSLSSGNTTLAWDCATVLSL